MPEHHIVIVGGGAAGLTTAGALKYLGTHNDALVVCPSLIDNSPYAIIESLQLGLNIIAAFDNMIQDGPEYFCIGIDHPLALQPADLALGIPAKARGAEPGRGGRADRAGTARGFRRTDSRWYQRRRKARRR